ncbi:hypothetical protein MJO29_005981 [Puccinia striiformis f. sp. tritici]|nr:hypothetical protein MJO29_005981 [Puccinia striiformis f. sp. tritici]KAI9604804.1 hypothetical protein H4Q26_002774 [Puccinia striiformis f. sp. tritici PST-130]
MCRALQSHRQRFSIVTDGSALLETHQHHQHLLITVEGLPSSSIAPRHRQKLLGIVGNCSASLETTYHCQKPPASLQDYLLVIGTTS